MNRIVVFGNSGSGKSTYAATQSDALSCSHMDLDTVAWDVQSETPIRRALDDSRSEILRFVDANDRWVVEGCYTDLLMIAIPLASYVVFLNPGTDRCISNARRRPWEPHKYESPEAQDANLEMLIGWIRQYDERDDEFSYKAHRRLFDSCTTAKREFFSNERD